MKINQIAQLTKLSAKTIRFYEERNLITPPHRRENGYRDYQSIHVQELNMIKRARLVGFHLDECKMFLDFFRDPNRKSIDVKQKAAKKLAEIDEQIAHLEEARMMLNRLVLACPGDEGRACPIIDEFTKLAEND